MAAAPGGKSEPQAILAAVTPSAPDATRPTVLWWPLALLLALLLADQLLKGWALAALTPGAAPLPFVPGLLEWQLTFNTGAAWSLLAGSAVPLAFLRAAVGLGLGVWLVLRGRTVGPLARFALTLIAAGALGNAVDGFRYGHVVDMLHSPLLSGITLALSAGRFPIFNIADSAVVLGATLLLVDSLIPARRSAVARTD